MRLSLDHIAIRVADFDKTLEFYAKYFGFVQFDSLDEPPEGKEVHWRSGDVHIEAFLVKDPAKKSDQGIIGKNDPGVCHFCLNVDQIEELYRRMKKDGVPMTQELTSVTLKSGKKAKFFFFKDPDDAIVEALEGSL